MKVVHLIGGGDTGGAKTHVLNLLYELNNHIETELICFRTGDFSEEARQMDIPITVIDTTNPFKEYKMLKELLKGQKIDLIHCHGARGNLLGSMIKKHLDVPMVSTVHSDYKLDYLGRPFARLSYGTSYIMALKKADYYIGVSDTMSDLLIGRGFPPDKMYTIYNGIDFSAPLPCKTRREFLKEMNFPVSDDDVLAGIAARLNPVKDIPTLLRAMELARKKAPNLKLIIAGDGQDEEKLKKMAADLGIADSVCFAGWLSDMNSFYNALDINLLTSISETFPYALTEGARMRNATIASRVGGSTVLIDDEENGFIFEPRDFNRLAEHLVTLATNHDRRTGMGELLYEKSARLFSIDKMVETQLEIYNSILHREERRAGMKRDGIIICGAYGHGNAGDDAILQSIIQSVRRSDRYIPITILAKNTMSVKKKFRVNAIYTFNVLQMFLSMRKSLLYINGGGSLIQNITSSRSLAYYLFTLTMARFTDNKVYMYGCGIGPIIGQSNIDRVTKVLNHSVDIITLREPHSMDELKSYGITEPRLIVTSDPALILDPADNGKALTYLRRHGILPESRHICFMLRSWAGFSEKAAYIAQCADKLYEDEGLLPVFLSMNTLHDTDAAREVISHMKAPCKILDDQSDPALLISILSHMDIVAAMRLHGLIFSSISGVPIVGISYDPKINSYMEYLGYGKCIDLPQLEGGNLLAALKEEYSNRDKREQFKKKARVLAKQEKLNVQMLRELLG